MNSSPKKTTDNIEISTPICAEEAPVHFWPPPIPLAVSLRNVEYSCCLVEFSTGKVLAYTPDALGFAAIAASKEEALNDLRTYIELLVDEQIGGIYISSSSEAFVREKTNEIVEEYQADGFTVLGVHSGTVTCFVKEQNE